MKHLAWKRLVLTLVFASLSSAASRYWVGGGSSAAWNAAGPTNWSAASGGANNASVPSSADDVFFDASSGAAVSHISASIAIRSLNMTGSTASVAHDASVLLTVAGSGVTFKLAAGKYTLGNAATSALAFTATSGTTNLTTAGNSLGNVDFNGVGGTWVMNDPVVTGPGAGITLTNGMLHTDGPLDNSGLSHSWGVFRSVSANTRALYLGSSSITMTATYDNSAWWLNSFGMNLFAGNSTITIVGVGSGFYGGIATYNNVVSSTDFSAIFSTSSTFKNLTVIGVVGYAVRDYQVSFLSPFTVTGTLTITGNSAVNRIFINNNGNGTDSPSASPVTITLSGPSSNAVITNADFEDIAFASANGGPAMPLNLSAIPGKSGDCGGNSNIIFTPAAAQTWSGSSSGNWSTNAWTTRVPLPQDDVTIPSASMTIVADMPRLGHNITWTGSAGSPVWAFTSIPANYIGMDIYGSLTLIPNLTITGTKVVAFNNRTPATLTSAGVTWPNRVIFQNLGSSMTLTDAFQTSANVDFLNGTLIVGAGGFKAASFSASGYTGLRTLTMGSGPWTLTGTGTVWDFSAPSGLTFNKGTGAGAISITDVSSQPKTFAGGGLTYNHITVTPGGSGPVTFTGANGFATFTATGPKSIVLPGSATTTVTAFQVSGTAGNLVTITPSAGTATVSQASGQVSGDYLSLTNIAAAGAVPFYAGTHSINGGGNTNWSFTSPGPPVETIGTPTTPSGPASGNINVSYQFSTGGATSSTGDPIQYQFDFGNGQLSGWLPVGTTQASVSWPTAGNYAVRVQARCSIHTSVVSALSAPLNVNITNPLAPAISLSGVSPLSIGLIPGAATQSLQIAVKRTNYAGSLTIGIGALPSGVHASITNPVNSTGSIQLWADLGTLPLSNQLISFSVSGAGVTTVNSMFALTVGALPALPTFGTLSAAAGIATPTGSLGVGPDGSVYILAPSGAGLGVWKSTNNGASFTGPVNVPNSTAPNFGYQLAVDLSGVLHVVFGQSTAGVVESYYSRSLTSGASFTTPIPLRTGAAFSGFTTSTASSPVVASDGSGNVYVAFSGFTKDSSSVFIGYDVWLAKSNDGGATFQPEYYVTNPAAPQRTPVRLSSNFNNYFLLFSDDTNHDLYFHVGNPATGGNNAIRVNPTVGKFVSGADLAFDTSAQNLYAAFTDSTTDPEGDVTVCRSGDAGASWGSCVRANDNTSRFQQNPALTFDNFGVLHVSWEDFRSNSKYHLYYARSTNGGATFSANTDLTADQTGNNFTRAQMAVDAGNMLLYVSGIRDNAQVVLARASIGVPQPSINPPSLSFGNQSVGTTSGVQSVTVTNNGSALSIASIAVTGANPGDFGMNNTCGSSLTAGANCSISVTFTPSAGGSRTAAVTMTDSAAGSPRTIPLSGTGATAPAVSLSGSSLTFASRNVGTTSAAQSITLTNTGSAALGITSIAVTGANPGDFGASHNCGASVAAGANCSISVTFAPTAPGSRAASVTITDNAAGSPHLISLSGTGTGAALITEKDAGISTLYAAAWNGFNGTTFRNPTLSVYQTTSGPNYEALLRFDGISVPPGSTVTSATLQLSLISWYNGARLLGYYVQSPWNIDSAQLGWVKSGDATVWNTPGALGDVYPGASFNSGFLTGTGDQMVTITLDPAAVNQAVAATPGSLGLLLAGETKDLAVTLYSGTNATVAKRPVLTIVTAGGGAAPAVSLSGSSLTFANQNVGTTSAAQSITLTNTGTATLTITTIAATGDFAATNTCAGSVAAGANCSISVTFTPTVAGARSGTVNITDNATGSPHSFSLSGTGVGSPAVSLSGSSLTFSNQNVGTTSAAQSITLTNTGNATLLITTIAATGDFAATNNCAGSVAAGANCSISVTFTPTVAGARSGTVNITDNATGSPHSFSLSGTGVGSPAVSLSGNSLTFSNQNVGTTSASQSITLTNTGNATLLITTIAATGDFAATNNCAGSVAAGANCSISVTFTPTVAGARTGTVNITDNATGSPHSFSLSGTGVGSPAVSLSGSSLTFANQNVGTTSASQSITLTNTGNATLLITNIAATGDFATTNTCAGSVAAGANCSISVTFTPTAAGARTGTVNITDNATGSPHSFSLSGTGVGAPAVSLSGASLTFSNQNVGTTSAAQSITLTNTGNATLTITNIAATGDFAATNNCAGSVAAGANCSISVTFTPTVAGARSGTVNITDNATGSPHSFSLSGTGVGSPAVSLSGNSLTFSNQNVGTTSAAQSITLTNTGNATLLITTIAATGDFAATNNCAGSVAAGANCSISVTFTPTAAGPRSGTVNITDNATGSPHSFSLSGTGVGSPAVSLSGASLTFASRNVGTTSPAQSITLTNTGTATLTITTIAVTGTNPSDFGSTNNCGGSVTAGANCSISVTFTPIAPGSRSAAVTITDNATGSPHSFTLSGTGVGSPAVSLSGASLTFASRNVGTTSPAQSITLTNTGTATLTITTIAVTGANPSDFGSTNNCGSSVAAGANCSISVTFTPTAAGARAAAVTITDNAAGSPHSFTLSGTGVASGLITERDVEISNLYAAAWNGFNGTTFRGTTLAVSQTTSGTGHEALLRFDGINVPQGSTVTSATLQVTLISWYNAVRLLGYYIQSPWDVTASQLGWVKSSNTTNWNAAGATADLYPGSFNTGFLSAVGDQTVTITLNPTSVNQALAATPGSLSLLFAAETKDIGVSIYSGTHATAAKRPVLTIVTSP